MSATNPQVLLEISRDGGNTWVSAGYAYEGAQGMYLNRSIWRKLGRVRADRLVFRLTQTDAVKSIWSGLWMRASQGSGEL